MQTVQKIKKLEREVAALWQIVDDERLWDPSVIREIRKRAKSVNRAYAQKSLRAAKEVFRKL